MLRGIMEQLKVVDSILPAVVSATTLGNVIDTQGYGALMLVFAAGVAGDTYSGSVKTELQVQESDDNSTYTACADSSLYSVASAGSTYASPAGAAATGAVALLVASASLSQSYKIGYRGYKRYVKARLVFSGTHTNGDPWHVYAILGYPVTQPVS